MPFVFRKAYKLPAGWRCEFFDPKQKDDYGRMGRTLTATIGEAIGESGFTLNGYEAKTTKRAIRGGEGLKKTVDVSEATVTRKSDGKTLKLVIAESKREKPMPVDVQATLAYERGTVKNFDVVPGSEIEYHAAGASAGTRMEHVRREGENCNERVFFEHETLVALDFR